MASSPAKPKTKVCTQCAPTPAHQLHFASILTLRWEPEADCVPVACGRRHRGSDRGHDYVPDGVCEDAAAAARQEWRHTGVATQPVVLSVARLRCSPNSPPPPPHPQLQKFAGPIDVVRVTLRERGFFGLYRGLSALVLGTASKAGVRFLVFDQIKAALADKQGKVTGARMMLAGLGAGEAIVAVTPTETIKTKLIQDQNQKNPRFKGLVHGTRIIFAEQGFKGLYQGVTTVIARQGANSAVRLSAYGLMREKLTEFYKTAPIPVYATFGIGAAAGVITVYTTMPLDVLKTKMQAEDARTRYRNTADCFVKTLREEGVLAFWKGATPRLGRLILHHAESLFLKPERNTMAKQRAARNGGDAGVAFSKALSYILRHGAAKEGIPMRTDGYVLVADLQRLHPQMRTKTLDDFKAVVAANDKQRFTLVRVADVDGAAHADDDAGEDVWMIKANQGHSLSHIEVELEEINNPGDLPVVVHGTYFRCLDSISKSLLPSWSSTLKMQTESQGLSKMNRNHIHFAVGKAGDLDVISGMRKSSQVLIYINVPLAMSDGIKFYRSSNNVILSSGIDGFIPEKYFLRIETAGS
ncbi:hypothetical protein HDU84_000879 [Entophlyctis sp. JEL0112]|nr:hypothetical protein HDU84_000879 [Entophlyctis sp. JEL0112]